MTQAQIIVRTPDGRDIPVQTDDPKLAAKAVRRMLAREAMSPRLNPKGVMKQGGFGAFTDAAANSATFGLSHLSNSGIAAGVTALKNLYTRAQGGQPAYGAGDAFAVEQAAQKAAAGEHPILSGLGGLLGGLGPGMEAGAGKFIMQGAAPLAARMGNVPGVSGLLKGLLTSGALPAIAARSVPLGAVGGALSQGASAPEAGQILPNAVSGAATGAAVSAAAPFAAKYVAAPVLKYAAAPVAKPVIKAAVGGARNLARTVNMLSAGAKSGPLLKPEWGALTAIRQALRADGATAAEIEAVSNQIASTGASTPALIDAVQKLPGGGQNTLKLLTGAAAKGKGANVAGRYVEDVSSKLQGRVQNRTQQLIGGDTRSLPGVQSDIASRIETATQGPNVTPGDAGAAVHAKLNEAYDAAQAATNRAYEAARSTRGTAALHPDSSAQLDQGVRTAIQDYEGLAPRAEALARQVRAAVKPADENIPPPPTGWERQFNNLDEYYAMMRRIPGMVPAPEPSPIEPLFTLRTKLGNLQKDGGTEGSAASALKRVIDQHLNGALDAGGIVGDPEAVNAWKTAIGLRRQQGAQFEGNDTIAQLVERGRHGEGRTNLVAPEDASNVILGPGQNISAKPDQIRDLQRMRDMLGADSPEWQALQTEANARLLARNAGTERYGHAADQFAERNPPLAETLITPEAAQARAAAQGQVAQAQGERQAVQTGEGTLRTTPDVFSADFAPGNADLTRLAAVRTVQNQVGHPAEGATGILNRIANPGGNIGQNLETQFGADATGPYQEAVQHEIDRLNTARLLDINQNSGTARRALAIADINLPHIPTGPLSAAMTAIRAIQRGAVLNDAEKEAITRFGTAEVPSIDLSKLDHKQPVTDWLRDYSANLTPLLAREYAQSGNAPTPKPSGITMEVEGKPQTRRKVEYAPDGTWKLVPDAQGAP